MSEFGQHLDRALLQISNSIDRLTQAMTTSYAQLHETMVEQGRRIEESNRRIEEQGARMEAMNRRIDENTAAIRENTVAILRIAEAIGRSRGDGGPGSGS